MKTNINNKVSINTHILTNSGYDCHSNQCQTFVVTRGDAEKHNDWIIHWIHIPMRSILVTSLISCTFSAVCWNKQVLTNTIYQPCQEQTWKFQFNFNTTLLGFRCNQWTGVVYFFYGVSFKQKFYWNNFTREFFSYMPMVSCYETL